MSLIKEDLLDLNCETNFPKSMFKSLRIKRKFVFVDSLVLNKKKEKINYRININVNVSKILIVLRLKVFGYQVLYVK